jgi:hypothetical protein
VKKSKKELIREKRRRKALQTKLIWGGLGVLVVIVLGYIVLQGARPAVGEEIAIPANYEDHVEEGADPGPYPSNPPAGGRHYAREFDAGFYDETSPQAQLQYPEGYIGHNLEHGYVIFWYNCSILSEANCTKLKSEIKAVMDDFGGFKLIAFPWESIDIPVAMTSWGRLQQFESFDPKIAAAFVEGNRNKAPEPNAP